MSTVSTRVDFRKSDLKGKKVFLIAPAVNATVEEHEYEGYDYVARINMTLNCFGNPPRTDIIFLNTRATKLSAQNYNKHLNNRIIFTKYSRISGRLKRKYPESVIIKNPWKARRNKDAKGYSKFLYMGTLSVYTLLKLGAIVTYGGADFYYAGFSMQENYPEGYEIARSAKKGRQQGGHKIRGDLRFFKHHLLVEFADSLTFHKKTEEFYIKSLEKYKLS